ncbi:MAG: DUF2339 domain-containing protein, partial [bacterium]|nr:DUF2339 domain-containing protein [bacterium]
VYALWFEKYYDPEAGQMVPALVYATLFYVLFLMIPMLHALLRPSTRNAAELKTRAEDMALLIGNAVMSYFWYHRILFDGYRHELGWVVLGQALVVFALFLVWVGRTGSRNPTAQCLMAIAIGLVTLSVPIHLKMYAVPIAWAIKGAVLVFLGVRFRQMVCKAAGVGALVLAVIALLDQLPLHTGEFTPVFNLAFGSWALTTASAALAAFFLGWLNKDDAKENGPLIVASVLLAFGLGCTVLSLEVWDSWSLWDGGNVDAHRASSLIVLWALIPAATATAVAASRREMWLPLPMLCYIGGAFAFLGGLSMYDQTESSLLALNVFFGSRLVFVVALWWGAFALRRMTETPVHRVCEMAGHVVLAVLAALEFVRWSHYTDVVSDHMGVSLISAAWAVMAFALIWTGLVTRCAPRRALGFVLFAIALGKITFWDMGALGRVHLIISCIVSGLLLLAAAYFYQKYSAILLGTDGDEEEEVPPVT